MSVLKFCTLDWSTGRFRLFGAAKSVSYLGTNTAVSWRTCETWCIRGSGEHRIPRHVLTPPPRRILWSFTGDQPQNAVILNDTLQIGYELLEVRTGHSLKQIYRTGYTPRSRRSRRRLARCSRRHLARTARRGARGCRRCGRP